VEFTKWETVNCEDCALKLEELEAVLGESERVVASIKKVGTKKREKKIVGVE